MSMTEAMAAEPNGMSVLVRSCVGCYPQHVRDHLDRHVASENDVTRCCVSERDYELLDLLWSDASTPAEQWSGLFAFVRALRDDPALFGAVSGDVQLAHEPADGPDAIIREVSTADLWFDDPGSPIRAATIDRMPLEGSLACEPVVLLPDDRLEVIDYDADADIWSLGHVGLASAPEISAPEGLKAWRVIRGPDQARDDRLLVFALLFGIPDFERGLRVTVRSRSDLWLPYRLDGQPNPIGPANARWLIDSMRGVATLVGARLIGGALHVDD